MILCAGQTLIDCIVTDHGQQDVAEDISLCTGGEAFNEAVTLARLGADVALLGGMGRDAAGQLLRAQAETEGVRLLDSGFAGATPVSLLMIAPDGGRKSRTGKAHALTGFVPEIPDEETPRAVTMASLFRPPFYDPAVCARFAKQAKARGALLLADTKLPKGRKVVLSDYRETFGLVDIITPNEEEALHYTGEREPQKAAAVFHRLGVNTVIIKLAERGCYVSVKEGETFSLPAFPVNVVDGVGAGDAFSAGLLYRLLQGADLYDATRFASACGALTAAHRGAVGGVQSAEQVFEKMKNEE